MSTKRRVLVADDEPGVIKFVTIGLTAAGYEVIPAPTGEEALKLAESEKPDIVLLDILMVPMGGFEVLYNLRTFSKIPVIVFTARSYIAEKAVKLGANGFISKPFRIEALISTIENTLDHHRPESGGNQPQRHLVLQEGNYTSDLVQRDPSKLASLHNK